jgi:hypothetical protein
MVDLVEKKREEGGNDSELAYFRKTMCCYINFSIDSVISNGKKQPRHDYSKLLTLPLSIIAFERNRTSNRFTNYILYSYLSVKHMIFRCRSTYRIRDIIKCFSEPTISTPENSEKPQESVVFDTSDFTGNPVNFVGTNIPSFYGGLSLNGWEKFKSTNMLSKEKVNA